MPLLTNQVRTNDKELRGILLDLYAQALSIDSDKVTTQELNKFIEKDTSISIEAILSWHNKEVSTLKDMLEELVYTANECPMCDHGILRNKAKVHWTECSYYKAEQLLKELDANS